MRARSHTPVAPLLALVALFAAHAAQADEILFKNGDRWTGELVSLEEGKLEFKTDLVGTLKVDAERVLTFRTDGAIEMHLRDGSVFVDAFVADEAGTVRASGKGAAGERQVRLEDAVAINPEEPSWKGAALAGAKFERGNTIKDEAYADVKVAYETEKSLIQLRGSYEGERTTSRSTGERTTNDRNLFGRILYDYYLGRRWLWFVGASGEKDGPANLDLRFTGGGGLGYRFWSRKDLRLVARLGPVWIREDFSDETTDEERISALLTWDFSWKLSPVWSLFNEGTYTQSLEDVDVALLQTQGGLRAELTRRIFFESKILYEWDSEPASEAERQDVDYILGVGYRFE